MGLDLAVNNLSSAFLNLASEINNISQILSSSVSKQEFSFAPAKTMKDAVALAKGKAEYWMGQGSNRVLDADALDQAAESYDRLTQIDPEDWDQYFLVSEDGSIGLTLDGCANIEWLYEMTFME